MKLFILLICLIISCPSFAELTCSSKGTRFIYINGVRTEAEEARDALKKLVKLVPSNEIDKKSIVEPVLSYNYTYGAARDFLETIVQKFPREFLLSNDLKDGYAAYMKLMQGKLAGKLSPAIFEEIINSAEEMEALATNLRRDTNNLMFLYEDALGAGYKVFAASHSQGGLFMNDAFSRVQLHNKHSVFAGLQVATPVNSINIPKFSYVTNDNDRVINLVRSQFGALEPNVFVFFADNEFNGLGDVPDFFLNHGITTTYLHDEVIRAKVIEELKNVAQMLEANCNSPVAEFSSSSRGYAQSNPDPMTFDFDGSISSDADESDSGTPTVPDYDIDPEGFLWRIDGEILAANGMKLTHTFQHEGSHTVELIVTDLEGNQSDPTTREIIVINKAPIASFSHLIQDQRISLNASLSKDEDGSISKYKWKIGNRLQETTSPDLSFLVEDEDSINIELVIVDNNGKESSPASKTIEVGIKGCKDISGTSYPGKRHTNPDGTPGGFIQDGATVTPSVYLSYNAEVCNGASVTGTARILSNPLGSLPTIQITDGAQISGNAIIGEVFSGEAIKIGSSSIGDNSIINGSSTIFESQITNTTVSRSSLTEVQVTNASNIGISDSTLVSVNISGQGNMIMNNSTLTDFTLGGTNVTISLANMTGGSLNGQNITSYNNTLNNVTWSGQDISVQQSTLNSVTLEGFSINIGGCTLTNAQIGNSVTISNSTIGTSTVSEWSIIMNSTINGSTLTNTQVMNSTITNSNLDFAMCMNVNLNGATSCW